MDTHLYRNIGNRAGSHRSQPDECCYIGACCYLVLLGSLRQRRVLDVIVD